VKLRNSVKIKLIILNCVFIIAGWIHFKPTVINYLNINFIRSQNVSQFANSPGSAMIYQLMKNKENENSLDEWNILVAHIGGFLTPHPLRFLKEYQRHNKWYPQIIEEFLYVSFWFFGLLPLFLIYFKEKFLDYYYKIEQIPRPHVLCFLLSSLMFSIACFSILFHTPQLFRYKVPINIYFFSIILYMVVTKQNNSGAFFRKYKLFLLFYSLILVVYSLVYFFPFFLQS
ncbi:MAG: hypothetical protein ACOYOK_12875, partial [Pseudobdellovibrionaceae bacterium]